MSIEDLSKYVANLWDWGIFDDCFGGTKIKMTDIDGMVERKGYFLVVEAKSQRATVKKGQQMLFDSLLATGKFTILVLFGEPGNPVAMQLMTRNGKDPKKACTLEDAQKCVAGWYQFADGH